MRATSEESATSSWRPEEEILLAENRPKKRAGRRVFKETRHPIFRGVRRRKNDKWVCELRRPETQARVWLGTYPTPEMAARAHDVAAMAFRGRRACLNFADSAWRLPVPASSETCDVRVAAAEAAELFRPVNVDVAEEEKEALFVDDDALLDAPRLFADLAEGLLLPPPKSFSRFEFDDVDGLGFADMSLWSYEF